MTKTLATWFCFLALMLFSSLSAEQRKPVIAVIGEPSLRDQSALMTAVLSGENAVTLVEREEMERILDEQKWDAAGLTRTNAMQLGQLLRADGLLLMRSSPGLPAGGIELRLVSVRPGIVLSNATYSSGVFIDEGIRAVVAPQLARLWPKLLVSPEAAIPLSFGGLHATADSTEMKSWERELSLLLEHRLISESKLFVLERKNMELLMAEKQWEDKDSALLTGRGVLEGRLEKTGNQLRISVQIQQPGAKQHRELHVEGPLENRTALIDRLAVEILASLIASPTASTWNATEEAKVYQSIAQWAIDHQLLAEAQAAAESSWALGARGDALNELRMKAYCLGAYPRWGTYRVGSFGNSYSFCAVDVRKEPQRLESAIRAVEILVDHLQIQPRTEQEYSAFHDEGGSNHDYRILSARVLLNASRLLRCFYEDDACSGHHERLAYLRGLIRFSLDILIRDELEIDERQLWIYRIQSAYAAYLYEKPEDQIRIYQSLLDRNIEAWLITSDPATGVWGPQCTDKNDGCIRHRFAKNPYRPPYTIDWNQEQQGQQGRAHQLWTEFLQKLQQSDKPHEQAAVWVFLSKKGLAPDLAPSLREFVWQHRERMADVRNNHFIWHNLGATYHNANPSREEGIRFYEYLMREGAMVDAIFAHWLLDKIDIAEADTPKLRAELDQYLARVGGQLSGDTAAKHIRDAKYWIGKPLEAKYQAWKKNGYSQPVKTEPLVQLPTAPAGALAVTRHWSTWIDLSGELMGEKLSGHLHADGKIWCFNIKGKSKVLGIDLQSFAVTVIDVPAQQYRHVESLAGGKGRLFATWDGMVHGYDFTTRTWVPVPVPPNRYALHYIEPYCYLLFGEANANDPSTSGNSDIASGVYRYDPRTDELKLLTSTRRRPALCDLDALPPYKPLHIESAKDGSLYLDIATERHGEHHIFFKANHAGEEWKQCFSVNTDALPFVHADPGGLLCEEGTRAYRYFPDLGKPNRMNPLLAKSAALASSPPGESYWEPPLSVVKHRKSRGIIAAATVSEDLWLLSMQEFLNDDWYFMTAPVLHHYVREQRAPQDINLDLQIPEADQTRIRELAVKSSDIAQVVEHTRQTVVPHTRQITGLIPVPDGFVFSNVYGFWHLTHADIKRNTLTSEK